MSGRLEWAVVERDKDAPLGLGVSPAGVMPGSSTTEKTGVDGRPVRCSPPEKSSAKMSVPPSVVPTVTLSK
jgi:hypothetical protein